MKIKNITPKIIELSKEISKYFKMEIYEGCWIAKRSYGDLLGNEEFRVRQIAWTLHQGFRVVNKTLGRLEELPATYFPIPSISDCLEKLLELGYESMNLLRRPFKHPWMVNVWDAESHDLDADTIKRWDNKGETLHKCLLSILLKTLRKEVSDE